MVDIINLTMAVTSLMSNVSQTEIQSLPYKYKDYISHDQTAQVYSNASLDFYEYDVGTEETVLRHAKIDNDLHDQTTWAYSTYYEDLSTYSFQIMITTETRTLLTISFFPIGMKGCATL